MGIDPNREQMAREHDELRTELACLEAAASEFRREGLHLLGPLRDQTESFVARLRKHMTWEEGLLPSHGQAGAHRDARDEERTRAHREQCELLDALVDDLRDGSRPPGIIAAHVAAVAGLVLRDFLEEESAFTAIRSEEAAARSSGGCLHG